MALLVPAGADDGNLLILPFAVHSDRDMTFLKNAVTDMMSSRLAQSDRIRPLSRETARKAAAGATGFSVKDAARIGRAHGVDYVVCGSLTILGDSISTDARVVDIARNRMALSFSDTGKNQGDVIVHINRLAEEIRSRVFGETIAGGILSGAAPAADAPAAVAESRRHPEKLWDGAARGDGTAMRTIAPAGALAGDVWRSRFFKTEIRGMAAADIDGDGQTEIAFSTGKGIRVFRRTDDRFVRVAEYLKAVTDQFVGMDAADINGNGRAEIFVTNLHSESQNLRSYVLEWDGRRLRPILERENWYWRVIRPDGGEPVLLGQKRGIHDILTPGIVRLEWMDGAYVPGRGDSGEAALPPWVTVFSVNRGNIQQNGLSTPAAMDKSGRLRVLDTDGSALWESPKPLGGSMTYLAYPSPATATLAGYTEKDHFYLPVRIIVRDADGDGKTDVLAVNNTDAANLLLQRTRLYTSGHVESMTWDAFGLRMAWRTREISGAVSDMALADIDNDGEDELVVSVIKKVSSVLGAGKSFIAAQEIPRGAAAAPSPATARGR